MLVPVQASDCPESHPIDCDDPDLACDELCEADGQCGTDEYLNNCGSLDVYRKSCNHPTHSPTTTLAPSKAPPTYAPTATRAPTVAPLRLVGGLNELEGRVEIFHEGRWGTICDDDWDLEDAHVVCQELFGTNALEAKRNAFFGLGKGRVWMSDLECTGAEEALWMCDFDGWGEGACDHSEDAGVVCDTTPAPTTSPAPTATPVPTSFLDYYHNAGWCDGPGTADDCRVENVECSDGEDYEAAAKCWAVCHAKYGDALASVDIDEHEGGSGRCDCCCQTECTCLRGRGIESFALPAGSEKPGACGDSGPADGAETPPSSPGDGDSSDGAAHAAATSVLVGLVAAFAV